MNNVVKTTSRDLLSCFFMECEEQFRFLENQHGFYYLSGMAEYRNNYKVIIPYNDTKTQQPFMALTRYERDQKAIEIVYGDNNFIVEIFLYLDPITRLELIDLMAAMRMDAPSSKAMSWMTDVTELQSCILSIAQMMKTDITDFLDPGQKLIDRALTMRGKRVEQAIRTQYAAAKEEASMKAAQAFMRQDYARVIAILKPFEHDLNKADLKKLKLARQKL